MRPVRHTKLAAMKYPIQTQIHDCHHERPSTIIEDEIIQVFWELPVRFSLSSFGLCDTHNIEGISNPKCDVVDPFPLSSFRFNYRAQTHAFHRSVWLVLEESFVGMIW